MYEIGDYISIKELRINGDPETVEGTIVEKEKCIYLSCRHQCEQQNRINRVLILNDSNGFPVGGRCPDFDNGTWCYKVMKHFSHKTNKINKVTEI